MISEGGIRYRIISDDIYAIWEIEIIIGELHIEDIMRRYVSLDSEVDIRSEPLPLESTRTEEDSTSDILT